MARQKVEQIQCDRCRRVELQPVSDIEKKVPDFHANFLGREITYTDLCTKCRETITHAWEDMLEWKREMKQGLLGAQVPQNQAAPLTPAPDYTPPKPHSAAGGKRS